VRFVQGVVTVGAVDCDTEANKPLCAKYQVQGFPTIKVRKYGKWISHKGMEECCCHEKYERENGEQN
jgi:hypothetical protein